MEGSIEKALEMLRELATRLGTTVEALWPAIIHRAIAEAVGWMAVFGLFALATGVGLRIAMRTQLWHKSRLEGGLTDGAVFLRVFSILAFLASLFAFGLAVGANAPTLIAPEVDALRFIKSLVR